MTTNQQQSSQFVRPNLLDTKMGFTDPGDTISWWMYEADQIMGGFLPRSKALQAYDALAIYGRMLRVKPSFIHDLKEEEADTPCKRIYLAVQFMYLDTPNLARYHQFYWEQVRPVIEAAPSTQALIARISELVLDGKYYKALKSARELIAYEQELVSNVHEPT